MLNFDLIIVTILLSRAGNIVPFSGRSDKSAPLVCTHTAGEYLVFD